MTKIRLDGKDYNLIERLPKEGEYFLDWQIFGEEDVDVRCFPEDKVSHTAYDTALTDYFGEPYEIHEIFTQDSIYKVAIKGEADV